MTSDSWPALPYAEWRDTYETLHMWTQVVGKVALAHAPPLNHSWGIALQVTPRGLATRSLPYGRRTFGMVFDFIDHQLVVHTSDGDSRRLPLAAQSVAHFYERTMALLDAMGLHTPIWSMPVEVPQPVRFENDTAHHAYDPDSASRAWRILLQVERVFSSARTGFVGKCSPAHFFWGAFDLAMTRFSGRLAPAREGPAFMREAYSHEVISHGFWPGNADVPEPMFYTYAVPEPDGFKTARVEPAEAFYHQTLGEFLLPYEAVRQSHDPDATLRAFLATTYDAGASRLGWDRAVLER